ncbi:TIGR04282 family arsenosugar biosynthesis glycosyltransferase [bacterium]|nr:TIGR04282 family arsenosugar biosynthesis glycosyltransferase [bacterium]
MSSNRVVIFSKSADLDMVKTRMRPVLTSEQSLSLHVALLQDTIDKVRNLATVLYLSGSGSLPFNPELEIKMQTGRDLGERMLHAFTEEFKRFAKIVIIGIDSPTVPVGVISRTFEALENHDIVLGPCEDGGYYLIGLKKLIPEVFLGIRWGTSDVLKQTLQKIPDLRHFLLDTYFDVDLPTDLTRLRGELERQNGMSLMNLRDWMTGYFGASAR